MAGSSEEVVINQQTKEPDEVLSLLGAISKIQTYYVIEKNSGDIPADFHTIEKRVTFFRLGFVSGFVESILLILLSIVIIPIVSDPYLYDRAIEYFPLLHYRSFIFLINYFPVVLFAGICCFLTSYRIGNITKMAIDNLLLGRLFSMLFKAILIFISFIYLSTLITEGWAWGIAKNISSNPEMKMAVYRVIMNLKPELIYSAFETFFLMMFGMIIPFVSVWLFSSIRFVKIYKAKQFFGDADVI
ncbi:MAG: hypothetical protein RBR08_12040 [Desulforegulaceae bacterium]|nr:hypothetical protein [Desulforegulaceae bacterium]